MFSHDLLHHSRAGGLDCSSNARSVYQGAVLLKNRCEVTIQTSALDRDSFLTRGNNPLRRALSFMSYSLARGVA